MTELGQFCQNAWSQCSRVWFSSRKYPLGWHPSSHCIPMKTVVQTVTLPPNCTSTWIEFSVSSWNTISSPTDVLILELSVDGLTYLLPEGQAPSRKHLGTESAVQWLGPRPCYWAPSEWVGLCVLITHQASCLSSLCPTKPHLQSGSNHGTHFIGWSWGLTELGKPKY